MGKSRLGNAFSERARSSTTVLAARCRSYGEGALYPLRRALLQLAKIDAGDRPELGRKKLGALAPDIDRLVVETLAAFIGLSEHPADIREAAWAIMELCDSLADEARFWSSSTTPIGPAMDCSNSSLSWLRITSGP